MKTNLRKSNAWNDREIKPIQNKEKGRSMTEMLGVLAVIGVLSVAGIIGYKSAMIKHKANNLLDEVSKRAVVVAGQLVEKSEANISDFDNENVAGLGIGFNEEVYVDEDVFTIETTGDVDKEICEKIFDQIGDRTAIRILSSGEKDVATVSDCSTDILAFTYTRELSGKEMIGECAYRDVRTGRTVTDRNYCHKKCQSDPDYVPSEVSCIADGGSYEDGKYNDSHCNCNSKGCVTADTPIMLADGTCKRADQITYEDELLVWNFDEGHFDKAKPIWLKVAEEHLKYNVIKFSDGSVLKTCNDHRIFNREQGEFTYPMLTPEKTPIGTHTLNSKGEWVTVVEKYVEDGRVLDCNIVTEKHFNFFAGNVLTGCRFNNMYPIKDLKFVKDNRELIPYSEYKDLPESWYMGLRLAEQPKDINRNGAYVLSDDITGYVKRMLSLKQPA